MFYIENSVLLLNLPCWVYPGSEYPEPSHNVYLVLVGSSDGNSPVDRVLCIRRFSTILKRNMYFTFFLSNTIFYDFINEQLVFFLH